MVEPAEGLACCAQVSWDVQGEEANIPSLPDAPYPPYLKRKRRPNERPTNLQELVDKNYAELRILIEKEMKLQETRFESYGKQMNYTCRQLQDQSTQMKFLTSLLQERTGILIEGLREGEDAQSNTAPEDDQGNRKKDVWTQSPLPTSDNLGLAIEGSAPQEKEDASLVNDTEAARQVPRLSDMPKEWRQLQEELIDVDTTSRYHQLVREKTMTLDAPWSHWCNSADAAVQPDNCLAKVALSSTFSIVQTGLILCNTAFMGLEADMMVKAALREPQEAAPGWLKICNITFTAAFGTELLFRMFSLGWWFWTCPSEWGWNVFDTFLVSTSVTAELLDGVNLSFIRLFRIFRVIQVARIIRVMRIFRNLRKMLFSILACLSSLAWAFLFLGVVMFMFSILFLTGVRNHLVDMEQSMGKNDALRQEISKWFGSMGSAMLACLAAVTGGDDWLNIKDPLSEAGDLYSFAFVIYTLFVTMGVMNVLTGVFLSSADEFKDHDMIIQDQHIKSANFVEHMFTLFQEFDIKSDGEVHWQEFAEAMTQDKVRAFLSSMDLEPTHVRLIFDLLDEKETGKITMSDFVMGMIRLKGTAKAIDSRIMTRELAMLPMVLKHVVMKEIESQRLCTPPMTRICSPM